MPQSPYIAVVLEGGLVQTIIVEAWVSVIPPPRIVVVDYDIEGADEDELTVFTIGADRYQAVCHGVEPTVFESLDAALSPRQLLTASNEQTDAATVPSVLVIARDVLQRILELDRGLEDHELATADDYNYLYVLANRGFREVLKALGDQSAIGS